MLEDEIKVAGATDPVPAVPAQHHPMSSIKAWQSGHHHPTGTVCCFRFVSYTLMYVLNMCCLFALPVFPAGCQPFGQGELLHIRSIPAGTGTINLWAGPVLQGDWHYPRRSGSESIVSIRRMVSISRSRIQSRSTGV